MEVREYKEENEQMEKWQEDEKVRRRTDKKAHVAICDKKKGRNDEERDHACSNCVWSDFFG